MKILVEEQRDLPLVEVQLVCASGPAGDPEGQEGLARHAFELLRRGAGGRSRAELDAAFDALGAQVDVLPSYDASALSTTCLTRNLEPTLALLGDVLLRPHLDEAEHHKLVREELAALDEVRDDDASLASRFFDRAALRGGPYGKSPLGSETSLGSLTRDDAAAWCGRALVADNLILGLAGDVSAERAAELGRAAFAGIADAPAPPLPAGLAPSARRRSRHTVLVDKPERVQSQILIGHAAPPPSHEDYLALHVACTAFGGTFTSRLMKEVRVKRGWSYGVSLRVARARAGHSLRLRVFPAAEQTPDTLALVLGLCEEVVAGGLTDEEVAHARGYLEGSWAFELATGGERLDRRIETDVLALPEDWVASYLPRLRALDASAVNAALRRHVHPEAFTVVLTATAAEMVPRLARVALGEIEVVDYLSY
jgi:zinc protease